MIGEYFGQLVVLAYTHTDSRYRKYYDCLCNCGKRTLVRSDNLRRKNVTSCGCFRIPRWGEDHPTYDHTKSAEDRLLYRNRRKDTEYKRWAKAVIRRDNKQCQHCGSNKKICVHHIEGYTRRPDLRYDINNGTALCEACHKEFHAIYSYRNFSKENFIEWQIKAVSLI